MTRYNRLSIPCAATDDFQRAVTETEVMVGTPIWEELSPEEQATLIYLRMRPIDAEYGARLSTPFVGASNQSRRVTLH